MVDEVDDRELDRTIELVKAEVLAAALVVQKAQDAYAVKLADAERRQKDLGAPEYLAFLEDEVFEAQGRSVDAMVVLNKADDRLQALLREKSGLASKIQAVNSPEREAFLSVLFDRYQEAEEAYRVLFKAVAEENDSIQAKGKRGEPFDTSALVELVVEVQAAQDVLLEARDAYKNAANSLGPDDQ